MRRFVHNIITNHSKKMIKPSIMRQSVANSIKNVFEHTFESRLGDNLSSETMAVINGKQIGLSTLTWTEFGNVDTVELANQCFAATRTAIAALKSEFPALSISMTDFALIPDRNNRSISVLANVSVTLFR